jgi:hypothetical protein
MRPSEISLDKLQLGDVSQNGRGGKSGSLSVNGKPLRLTLRSCTTPFEVSSYDRVSDRKSLDLRADDETAAFLTRLDTELKKYAGKVGCAESGYTSLLKQQKEGFAPLYRNKITILPSGKSPCKFFEAGSKRRLTDEEVAELPLTGSGDERHMQNHETLGERREVGRFLHARGHHGEALRPVSV